MRIRVLWVNRREETLLLNLFFVFDFVGENASTFVAALVEDPDGQRIVSQLPSCPHVKEDVDESCCKGCDVGNKYKDVAYNLCVATPGHRIENASHCDD